jgi:hypothetical protein
LDELEFVLADLLTISLNMCAVTRSRLFFELTAVSASDHLRAFNMCRDNGSYMVTLPPYASSRLLLMECVCVCLCVLGLLDGAIRDESSRTYYRLCMYMRTVTPYYIMKDFNGLVFDHTVHIWRLLRPCAFISSECPAPSAAARHGPSYRPSHIKHAPSPLHFRGGGGWTSFLFSEDDKEVVVVVIVKVANIPFLPKPNQRSARTPRS